MLLTIGVKKPIRTAVSWNQLYERFAKSKLAYLY